MTARRQPVTTRTVPEGDERQRWVRLAALAAVLLVLLSFSLRQVGSFDVGFHLEAGNHILDGNGWPRTDPFTYTLGDREYVDTSWGFQVAVALAERMGGAPALVLAKTGVLLALFWMLWLTARLGPAGERAAPLLLLGVAACEMRFEVRPELLSYLFLAVVLYLLRRHAAERPIAWYWLPAVHLVWVNCHSLFVLGWAAIGCFVVGSLLRERRLDSTLVRAGAASVAVTLINPYGWKALAFPFTLATRMREGNAFNQTIGEFISPMDVVFTRVKGFPYVVFDPPTFVPWGALLSFGAFVLLAAIAAHGLLRQRRYAELLVVGGFGALSLSMIRNIPLLVVAVLPAVAWGLGELPRVSRVVRHRVATAALLVLALPLSLRVVHDGYYVSTRRVARFGLGWNEGALPVAAADYLRRTPEPGRLFNHLNFGGYLMWALDEPVFIDGRLEVVGERFFDYYRGVLGSPEGLAAATARHDLGRIVFPYRIAPRLLNRLSADPTWRLAHVDSLAAVFVLDGPGATGLVDETVPSGPQNRQPPQLGDLPGLGGGARRVGPAAWAAGLARRRSFPEREFQAGLFHYFRREWSVAATHFAAAVRHSGGAYYEIYNNLGSALYRLGDRENAAACYRIVLQDAPRNPVALKRLAEIESRPVSR
ncbi:MAG: hypothetical protein GY716_09020 [bacterium]|nr:hypothetical protein [bacterium]